MATRGRAGSRERGMGPGRRVGARRRRDAGSREAADASWGPRSSRTEAGVRGMGPRIDGVGERGRFWAVGSRAPGA